MPTPRQVAEAFSGHRFRAARPALGPDVRRTSVGQGTLTGEDAVTDARATLRELPTGTARCERFVVARADDGALTATTSHAVELDPAAVLQCARPARASVNARGRRTPS